MLRCMAAKKKPVGKTGKRKAKPKSPARKAPRKASKPPEPPQAPARKPLRRRFDRHAIATAEHEHQDPRGVGDHGSVLSGGFDARPVNWGQQKAKSVGRLDKVSNWFRKGRGR